MRVLWILAVAVMAAGCGERTSARKPSEMTAAARPQVARPSPTEISGLQKLADEACRCARSNPQDAGCWQAFEAKISPYKESVPAASACAPVSTEIRCFNEDQAGGGFCITTGYSLVTSDTPEKLCSEREAQIVEAAYYEAFERAAQDDRKAAKAAERAVRALIRGEDIPYRPKSGGCVG